MIKKTKEFIAVKIFFLCSSIFAYPNSVIQEDVQYNVLPMVSFPKILSENTPEKKQHGLKEEQDQQETIQVAKKIQEEGDKKRKEFNEKGYFSSCSEAAKGLLTIHVEKKINAKGNKKHFRRDDPYYQHLRDDLSDIPLVFPFSGFSQVDRENLIGYAPSGGYNDATHQWTAVTGYFNHDKFGTCRAVIFHLDRNEKIYYDEKFTKYLIHKKPTTSFVEGNKASGFIYQLSWTGKHYDKHS